MFWGVVGEYSPGCADAARSQGKLIKWKLTILA
jgi:hypothetical protein